MHKTFRNIQWSNKLMYKGAKARVFLGVLLKTHIVRNIFNMIKREYVRHHLFVAK